jgi:hypothetical protein
MSPVTREELESLRLTHHVCEDTWYSCPKSAEGCADDRQTDCNCGADEQNARLDALLARSNAGSVLVPLATLNKWGEALQPYIFDGSYNNDGVMDTIAEMATFATKGHGHP